MTLRDCISMFAFGIVFFSIVFAVLVVCFFLPMAIGRFVYYGLGLFWSFFACVLWYVNLLLFVSVLKKYGYMNFD